MIHQYKLGGHNIVLDINSGSVHSVDDVTYDIIGLYETVTGGELYKRVIEIHPNVTMTDIREILDDIEKLINQGKLFSAPAEPAIPSENVKGSQSETLHSPNGSRSETMLKALCLNVSHECNMNCAYCFAANAKKGARPQEEVTLMPFDTGKQAIDFLIAQSGGKNTLDIDFFGGEPLLNWKVVKEIVAYARIAERMTGKKLRFTLTTNGLLIDDDVIDFTNKYFHNVVLSLDGRPETHNAMRKLPDGTGSYEAALPNIKKLVEARRGKGYYIRGTYTRENMDFVKDILHLADELGFMELSLEPAVAKRGDPLGFTEADLPELFNQYDVLAVEMQRRKEFTKFIRPEDIPDGEKQFRFYHYNIDLEHGPCLYKRLAGCGVATQYLAVTPGGELYPCHQFIGDDAYLMGDVWKGITNSKLRAEFANANINTRPECKACWARYYCSGGCAANVYHDTGSISGVYKFGCELFKKRIENAIMLKF